ncbi:hypothetical protein L915_19651 [Plasmopara halstedii]|uniref:PH domain-containing protein n=1 Tax=Plasmopara halstedii TaxID=4781 RepID=A0A0P1AC93_PLAHL|nr:hypothetical protein L915_19651 [Plasmopara halstedii]CEG38490.1 hypothetical protein L915_19651 [Plasmopara halstedii]|eukprot:XP_024574859.1 hypothetical protein L915_19651 [Plasmopara halstedii]
MASTPTTAASSAVRKPSWQNIERYSVYDAEVSSMMDDRMLVRPSLLSFRPSRMLRVSQQQHHNAVYKAQLLRSSGRPTERSSETSDEDGYESSDTGNSDNESSYFPSPAARNRDKHAVSTVDEDEEMGNYMNNSIRLNRAESLLAIMALPASGTIPLLERLESEDDDNEIDTIICDPTRLPRTLLVDENGLTISRESVMMRAATVPRGGVIKSGVLFKQGFGFRSGGWKVRFAVLTGTKMTLFREEHGRKRGEIDLAKCNSKSIEIMPQDSVFDGSQATMWRFAIRGKKGRVLLSAYTEAEMKDWLRCIHVALASQGFGRFTDLVVPSGTFLAERSGGLLRSSGNL